MYISGINLTTHAVLDATSAVAKQRRFNLSPRCSRWAVPGCAYRSITMLLTAEANHNTCLGEIRARELY